MAAQRVLADATVVVCIKPEAVLADDNTMVPARARADLPLELRAERDREATGPRTVPGALELEAISVGRCCCDTYAPPIASTMSTAGCALGSKVGRGSAAPAACTRLGKLGGVPTCPDGAEARGSRLCLTPALLLCFLQGTSLLRLRLAPMA